MGDADETYPMSDLTPFVERLAAGDDLVMGSRFKGTIHGEAMPWLNRHIGNPILTGMLNVLFGVKVSDAHCGMRAVRRDALPALDLHSTGMEFASEMVFKAYRRGLRVSEVPIDYYPRVGESKLNRFGDAWRHVASCSSTARAGCTSCPGVLLLLLGLVGGVALAAGPVDGLRPDVADPHDASRASSPCSSARRSSSSACSRGRTPRRIGERDPWLERARGRLTLEHGLVVGGLLLVIGLAHVLVIFVSWALDGFGALSHEYATAIGFTLARASGHRSSSARSSSPC